MAHRVKRSRTKTNDEHSDDQDLEQRKHFLNDLQLAQLSMISDKMDQINNILNHNVLLRDLFQLEYNDPMAFGTLGSPTYEHFKTNYIAENKIVAFTRDKVFRKLEYSQSKALKVVAPIPIPKNDISKQTARLSSFLGSFISLDDDLEFQLHDESYNAYLDAQIILNRKIDALQEVGLLSNARSIAKPFVDYTQNTLTTSLCKEAAYISNVMMAMRKHKVNVCRKLSKAVQKQFELNQTTGERAEKLEERRVKKLAKDAANEVRKQWKLAEAIVTAKRKMVADLEAQKAGKEHLFAIIEQSTQVLKDQQEIFRSASDKEANSELSDEISDDNDDEDVDNDSGSDIASSDLDEGLKVLLRDDDDEEFIQPIHSDEISIAHSDDMDVDAPLEENIADNGAARHFQNESHALKNSNDIASLTTTDNEKALASHSESFALAEDLSVPEVYNDMTDIEPLQPSSSLEFSNQVGKESTTSTLVPPLLKHHLREYQHSGLSWLVGLYNKGLNGILADEMGLGKTIQTIALLAYLAYYKGIWGPHLIIVPTSVLLNWEFEFKKWCPAFKILTYYGSQRERKEKREGWSKDNAFHICITSYQLVLTDQSNFKRRFWQYMILDEAHNIKNFRSQRWQTLLTFNSERRLLLTGTPLQNNLMELWSLLYFLMPRGGAENGTDMPTGFASQKEFMEWFQNPVEKIIDTNSGEEQTKDHKDTVLKLHTVLRPFLLRRLKKDVEKEMPAKIEHVVYCRLSRRQRYLYDDFMSRAKTKEDLASGNYMSILNCLMQLRKVCNHPDLFEVRSIFTSFAMGKSVFEELCSVSSLFNKLLARESIDGGILNMYTFLLSHGLLFDFSSGIIPGQIDHLDCTVPFMLKLKSLKAELETMYNGCIPETSMANPDFSRMVDYKKVYERRRLTNQSERWTKMYNTNRIRLLNASNFVIGARCIDCAKLLGRLEGAYTVIQKSYSARHYLEYGNSLRGMVQCAQERANNFEHQFAKFSVPTRKVVVGNILGTDFCKPFHADPAHDYLHPYNLGLGFALPDKYLLQYDCGKLQTLAKLLRELKGGGHRALIFTQMTKMLDILEGFLNMHGYIYLRLDGSTNVEQRQVLMDRFNNDARILVFILSTRSGGVGMNLVGADSVIFYDSDWNPAMDAQAQDRAHRIGQTRNVHIYRFITEHTIEENMLKKANKKRALDNIVIQEGQFNTDFFRKKMHWKDWLGGDEASTTTTNNNGESIEVEELDGKSMDAKEDKNVDLLGNLGKYETALQDVEDEADVIALCKARKEILIVDEVDFSENATAVAPLLPPAAAAVVDEGTMMQQQVRLNGVEAQMFAHILWEWGYLHIISVRDILE